MIAAAGKRDSFCPRFGLDALDLWLARGPWQVMRRFQKANGRQGPNGGRMFGFSIDLFAWAAMVTFCFHEVFAPGICFVNGVRLKREVEYLPEERE